MDSATMTFWGGIGGAVVGVLGGLAGTYCSIRNTDGPRERAWMIRASLICWLLVTLFLVGMWLIPAPYRFLLWLPYPFLLIWGIRILNQKQAEIRRQEAEGRA